MQGPQNTTLCLIGVGPHLSSRGPLAAARRARGGQARLLQVHELDVVALDEVDVLHLRATIRLRASGLEQSRYYLDRLRKCCIPCIRPSLAPKIMQEKLLNTECDGGRLQFEDAMFNSDSDDTRVGEREADRTAAVCSCVVP